VTARIRLTDLPTENSYLFFVLHTQPGDMKCLRYLWILYALCIQNMSTFHHKILFICFPVDTHTHTHTHIHTHAA
jgi:hypothetical protein